MWLSYFLWEQNSILKQRLTITEKLNKEYSTTVQRLSNLEALLKHETELEASLKQNAASLSTIPDKNEPNNKDSISNTQSNATTKDTSANIAKENDDGPDISVEQAMQQEGPGHEEFPVVDEGIILIENVQSRLVEPRRVRTSLDLRNPGSTSLAGAVFCILSLASGEMVPLTLTPSNVGNYRILRWKKAVLFANIAPELDLFNAQMIIEVKDTTGKLLYRNAYALEQ